MLDPMIGDDSTGYAGHMNNDNNKKSDSLHELACDLNEVYGMMTELCETLQGGGIIQARDIEPSVARVVPKLRRAVTTLARATETGRDRELTGSERSPLLM